MEDETPITVYTFFTIVKIGVALVLAPSVDCERTDNRNDEHLPEFEKAHETNRNKDVRRR